MFICEERGEGEGGQIRRTERPTSEPAAPVRLETAPAVAYVVQKVLVGFAVSMKEQCHSHGKTYGADEAAGGRSEAIELRGHEGRGCGDCKG